MQIAVSPHICTTYDSSVDPPVICIIVSLDRAAADCRRESRRREQVAKRSISFVVAVIDDKRCRREEKEEEQRFRTMRATDLLIGESDPQSVSLQNNANRVVNQTRVIKRETKSASVSWRIWINNFHLRANDKHVKIKWPMRRKLKEILRCSSFTKIAG